MAYHHQFAVFPPPSFVMCLNFVALSTFLLFNLPSVLALPSLHSKSCHFDHNLSFTSCAFMNPFTRPSSCHSHTIRAIISWRPISLSHVRIFWVAFPRGFPSWWHAFLVLAIIARLYPLFLALPIYCPQPFFLCICLFLRLASFILVCFPTPRLASLLLSALWTSPQLTSAFLCPFQM